MFLWSKFRRSRGFGVHSPFAFDLLSNTLHEPKGYAYYPDGDIDKNPVLRLIMRLVARFTPRRVMVSDDPDGLISRAVARADSRVSLTGDAPDMVILSGSNDSPQAVDSALEAIKTGGVVFIINRRKVPDIARLLKKNMTRGMTFYSRHKLLIVAAPHLPRRDYEISF